MLSICASGGDKGHIMTFKDSYSTILSTLAFLISASSAYYSTVRQADDLKIIITEYPRVSWDSATSTVKLHPNHTIVVVNHGTQPAAVLSYGITAYFDVGRGDRPEEIPCWGDAVAWATSNVGPATFKERDVAVKTVGVDELPKGAKRGDDGEYIFDLKEKKNYKVATICLTMVISTPSKPYDVVTFGIREGYFEEGMKSLGPGRIRSERDIQVIKNTKTIFN